MSKHRSAQEGSKLPLALQQLLPLQLLLCLSPNYYVLMEVHLL